MRSNCSPDQFGNVEVQLTDLRGHRARPSAIGTFATEIDIRSLLAPTSQSGWKARALERTIVKAVLRTGCLRSPDPR